MDTDCLSLLLCTVITRDSEKGLKTVNLKMSLNL